LTLLSLPDPGRVTSSARVFVLGCGGVINSRMEDSPVSSRATVELVGGRAPAVANSARSGALFAITDRMGFAAAFADAGSAATAVAGTAMPVLVHQWAPSSPETGDDGAGDDGAGDDGAGDDGAGDDGAGDDGAGDDVAFVVVFSANNVPALVTRDRAEADRCCRQLSRMGYAISGGVVPVTVGVVPEIVLRRWDVSTTMSEEDIDEAMKMFTERFDEFEKNAPFGGAFEAEFDTPVVSISAMTIACLPDEDVVNDEQSATEEFRAMMDQIESMVGARDGVPEQKSSDVPGDVFGDVPGVPEQKSSDVPGDVFGDVPGVPEQKSSDVTWEPLPPLESIPELPQ